MKKLLLVILLLTGYAGAIAQDWQSVRLRDTVFYGLPSMPVSYRINNNLLRTMWVDSAKAIAGDSLFYFFRGIRLDTPFMACQDTLAPAWLGSHVVRKADGTEYYFGRWGDTITFRTRAGLGEHWIIGRDVWGTDFQGTVTSLTLEMVEGVPDSVKTISIQAFRSGMPVFDPYNSMVFQLSKGHGWIATLDLYRFTDARGSNGTHGLLMLPQQHQRLPRAFGLWKAGYTDLSWRYAVGNDFITVRTYGVPNQSGNGKDPAPVLGGNEVITHDSVQAMVMLSPGKAAVTFFTSCYSHIWTFKGTSAPPGGFADTVFTSSYIHTDTIEAYAGREVRFYPIYESKNGPLSAGMPSGFERQYVMDSLSNGAFSLEEVQAVTSSALVKSGGCWTWQAISPDPEARISNWVENFGTRASFYYYASPMPIEYDRLEVTYANLPGLTWGRKINVAALGVSAPGGSQAGTFIVQPNPTNNEVTISSTAYRQPLQVTMRNTSGQCVRQFSFSERLTMPTADLAPGLYSLEVTGKEVRQIVKLVVQH